MGVISYGQPDGTPLYSDAQEAVGAEAGSCCIEWEETAGQLGIKYYGQGSEGCARVSVAVAPAS